MLLFTISFPLNNTVSDGISKKHTFAPIMFDNFSLPKCNDEFS